MRTSVQVATPGVSTPKMPVVQSPVCRCESSEESLESCSHRGLVSLCIHVYNYHPLEKMDEHLISVWVWTALKSHLRAVHTQVLSHKSSQLMLIRLKKEAEQREQQEQCIFIMEVLQVKDASINARGALKLIFSETWDFVPTIWGDPNPKFLSIFSVPRKNLNHI